MKLKLSMVALTMLFGMVSGSVSAELGPAVCGELKNHYGPFDYTSKFNRTENLPIVEHRHFTADVENLIRGSTGSIDADLAYTLHTCPNHHRALQSLLRLAKRDKKDKFDNMRYPVECYFERGVRMSPKDITAQMLYATYLAQVGKNDEALQRLLEAEKQDAGDANLQYNLGLAYLKKKDYVKANEYAQKAYAQSFPLAGLRDQLKAAGRWNPVVPPSPEPQSSAPTQDSPAAEPPPAKN